MRGHAPLGLRCFTAGCLLACAPAPLGGRDAGRADSSISDVDAADAPGNDAPRGDASPRDAEMPGPLAVAVRDVPITPVGSARVPDVAYDADHDAYVVVYTWVPGPEFRTEARVVTVDASGLPTASAPLTIDSLAGVSHNSADGAVATGLGAPALIVWTDDRLSGGSGQLEIFGQFVDVARAPTAGLALRGAPFRISEIDVTNESSPAVVWTGVGYYVAWADDAERGVRHEDARVVYGRTVSTAGALGATTRLGDDTLFQTFPQLSRCGDRLLAAWTDYVAPGGPLVIQYRGRVLDAAIGAPIGPIVTLVASSMTVSDPPAITCDAAREVWRIAWANAGTPSSKQIRTASIDRDGVVGGGEEVTTQPDGAGAPRLAWIPATGTSLLSFHAQDTTFGYARELGRDGSPTGPVVSLSEGAPSLGTFWTAVAAHTARPEALVVTTVDYNRVAASVWRSP